MVRAWTPKYLSLLEQICPAKRFACPLEARLGTKVECAGVATPPQETEVVSFYSQGQPPASGFGSWQAAEKRPSAAAIRPAHLLAGVPRVAPYPSQRHPSSFPVSSTGKAYCGVPQSTPLADSPTRRRGKKSLLIRRDATLRILGAPVNGISQTQLASACLREAPPCGAKAGTFLSSLRKMTFSANRWIQVVRKTNL
jgi:hypothetical protein